MLTKRAMEVLGLMKAAQDQEDWEGAEIVCSGIDCWLGETRISRSTVTCLVRHVAVSLASEPDAMERYTLSGTGKAILDDPATADRIVAALYAGRNVDATGNPV